MSQIGHAKIKNSPVSGRGLFADEDLAPGSLIFSIDRPLLCVIANAHLYDTCANCFTWVSGSAVSDTQQDVRLAACSRCKQLKFCTKMCQSQAWKRFHKFECKSWDPDEQAQPKNLPQVSRAVMDLLSRKANGSITDAEWVELLKLQSHYNDLRSEKKNNVDMLGGAAWNYSPHKEKFSPDFVLQVTSMIVTNSLTLITPTFNPIGLCLDPFAVCANHSCDPNAFVVMDGAQLSMRTLRPIRKDEEILISYVDGTATYATRQRDLKEQFFFTCRCSKCEKGPTLQEDLFLVPIDEVPKRLEVFAAEVHENGIGDGRGNLTPDTLGSVATIEKACADDLQACSQEDGDSSLQRLAAVMKLLALSKIWPVTREPFPSLRHTYFITALSNKQYMSAFLHGLKIWFDINPILYPRVWHHPLRVVHTWTLAKLTLFLAEEGHDSQVDPLGIVNRAKERFGMLVFLLMREVAQTVGLSHGDDSAFANMVRRKFDELSHDLPLALRRVDENHDELLGYFRELVDKGIEG